MIMGATEGDEIVDFATFKEFVKERAPNSPA